MGLVLSVVFVILYFTSRVNMPELLIAAALFYIGYRISGFRKVYLKDTRKLSLEDVLRHEEDDDN